MQELIKQTQERIKDLEVGLESGMKAVRELNYQRDLQQIDNTCKENELQALSNLLEDQSTPPSEKYYTPTGSSIR